MRRRLRVVVDVVAAQEWARVGYPQVGRARVEDHHLLLSWSAHLQVSVSSDSIRVAFSRSAIDYQNHHFGRL